jgi:5-methylthioadenosine/S-adenosylhomocysteine deaminase
LSSGIARIADMVAKNVNVSIGTDGPASNNDLDLFHEAQLAALVQKGVTGDPRVLPAEKVFSMLTIDGARALGLNEHIGSIEAGKFADLAVIYFDAVNLTPVYDYYSHLIYAISAADVSDVMINGRMIMRNREMLDVDATDIKARARKVAQLVKLI